MLVTGAQRGIGRALAVRVAVAGAGVGVRSLDVLAAAEGAVTDGWAILADA